MTTSDALRALDARIVAEAVDAVRIAGRLDQLVADAIERAPAVAAWARLRLRDDDWMTSLRERACERLDQVEAGR
jgi:hypothetical protein